MNMNKFTKFLRDTLANVFGERAGVPGDGDDAPKIYNQEQVKAGIVHLRNSLMGSDPRGDMKADYNDAFRTVRLKPRMTGTDIHGEMGDLLDRLLEHQLITPEEQENVDLDLLQQSMTGMVIHAIEANSFEENLLNSIRFDQDLRSPKLRVVHRSIDNE